MVQVHTQRRNRSVQQSISPQFLLRVGGLPINVVDALRFEQTVAQVERLLTIEKKLAERKDKLVEALFEAVTKHKDEQALRRKLINFKRSVFNLQMLDALDDKRSFALKLASPERELLLEWLELWGEYRALLIESPVLLALELDQKRALLKETINIPAFRKGIALASPVLERSIEAYLATANDHFNRNARTTERSLFEYLLRTACKTSPFSTFTSICPGVFASPTENAAPDMLYQVDEMEQRSFTTLNVAILSKLSSEILNSEALKKALTVQLTPGWHIEHNRIRYLRRVELDETDENVPVDVGKVHEDVFYLQVGHLLATLLTLLHAGRKVRFSALSAELQAMPEYATFGAQVDDYLAHLLRLGLLIVPDLQLDLHSDRPIASYCRGLRALDIETTDRLAAQLEGVESLVDRYATASYGVRNTLLEEIRQQMSDCFSLLGQSEASLPHTLIYEDTTIRLPQLTANSLVWREAISHLAELQQILPVFDINLERKVVTRGYFRARYGAGQRCDDFLHFASEFRQNFFEQYLQGSRMSFGGARPANHFSQPELDHLYESKQVIADYIRQVYRQHPHENQELILDDAFIQAVKPCVPEDVVNLASNTFFSQFARVNGDPLVIVNRVYTGFTQIFSRFAHFFREEEGYQLLPMLRATLEQISPPGAVFAELKGGYDAINLNLHPQVTAYELVCPGDISSRPLSEQIPLEDLYMLDDEDEGRLRLYSKSLGKEIIPLYLGFLLPMALPEMQQILLNFSYGSMCLIDLWKGFRKEESDEEIVSYPRLRYKNLVLHRAQWKIPVALFPRRASGQNDFELFLALNRWRIEQKLPRRVFIAPEMSFNTAKTQTTEDVDPGQQMRNYKPLYIDFENLFSLQLLEALLRDSSQRLVLSEMLPEQDQLWLRQHEQAYVSEFVLEMNTVKGAFND